MVQKSFLHLVAEDIALYQDKAFPRALVDEMKSANFKSDGKGGEILMKHLGSDWKHKCERSLMLAKQLGNM